MKNSLIVVVQIEIGVGMNQRLLALSLLILLSGCEKRQSSELDDEIPNKVRSVEIVSDNRDVEVDPVPKIESEEILESEMPQFFFGKYISNMKKVEIAILPYYKSSEKLKQYDFNDEKLDSLINYGLECEIDLDGDVIDFLKVSNSLTKGDSVYLLSNPESPHKLAVDRIIYKVDPRPDGYISGGVFAVIEALQTPPTVFAYGGKCLAVKTSANGLLYALTKNFKTDLPTTVDSVFTQLKASLEIRNMVPDSIPDWNERLAAATKLSVLNQEGLKMPVYFLIAAIGWKDFDCDNRLVDESGSIVYPSSNVCMVDILGIVKSKSHLMGDMVIASVVGGAVLITPDEFGGRLVCSDDLMFD